MKYVLSPFKGDINLGYNQGLKLYLHTMKYIEKESESIEVSDSNERYILDCFIGLANNYC